MGMVALVFMAICTGILLINLGMTDKPKRDD